MPLDYLRQEFVTEGRELTTIFAEVQRARGTLVNFAVQGRWPYEVTTYKPLEAPKPSHSTSAMTLCALGIATGRIKSPVVAPFVRAPSATTDEERKNLDNDTKKYDENLDDFLKQLPAERKGNPGAKDADEREDAEVSRSKTYGNDDPFTLIWMLELLRSRWQRARAAEAAELARVKALANDRVPKNELSLDVFCELRRAEKELKKKYDGVAAVAERRVVSVYRHPTEPWKFAFKENEDPDDTSKERIEHAFPVLRVIQIAEHLKRFRKFEAPRHEALLQYLRARLYLHLAYWDIRDGDFDAAELVFIVEAMLLLDENSIDAPTVQRYRKVLLAAQEKNAYWRPLRPFLATPQGMALLPLSIETANSLVRSSEILARREWAPADRSDDLLLLRRYTDWLLARKVFGKTPEGKIGEQPGDTGKGRAKKEFTGWCSEHIEELGKIHIWLTSQVLVYLAQYHAFLDRQRADMSLSCMNLKVTEPPHRFDPRRRRAESPSQCWKGELDGDLSIVAGKNPTDEYAVYRRIDEDFMQPRAGGEPTDEAQYSMLFYGPQGTGKTRLAKKIADCLGYRLISISPSDFMVSGDTLLEARARDIFDVLEAQIEVVILLDEIDQLILDRNSRQYVTQGDYFKLMTPGMLTKFNDLRAAKRSIFIVSTNYADHIDPAIKRKGRIDDLLLILPPDLARRARIVSRALNGAKRSEDVCVPRPVDERWKAALKGTALFIFKELEDLAKGVAKNLSGPATEDDVIKAVTDAQRSEPTIDLESYRSRFRAEQEKSTEQNGNGNQSGGQKPYDEFLMLMYLVRESGGPVDESLKHLVAGSEIGKYIKSKEMQRAIRKAIGPPDAETDSE